MPATSSISRVRREYLRVPKGRKGRVMGSNQNRFGDKAASEWGSKARKEEAKSKKKSKDEFAIEDSVESNEHLVCNGECGHCSDIDMKPKSKEQARLESKRKKSKRLKLYCKGKVDTPHDWSEWENMSKWISSFRTRSCNNCGKNESRFR